MKIRRRSKQSSLISLCFRKCHLQLNSQTNYSLLCRDDLLGNRGTEHSSSWPPYVVTSVCVCVCSPGLSLSPCPRSPACWGWCALQCWPPQPQACNRLGSPLTRPGLTLSMALASLSAGPPVGSGLRVQSPAGSDILCPGHSLQPLTQSLSVETGGNITVKSEIWTKWSWLAVCHLIESLYELWMPTQKRSSS